MSPFIPHTPTFIQPLISEVFSQLKVDMEDFFESLPEGFIAEALALTSPRDVSRLSTVNSVFRSAAQWDSVWESFTPPEYMTETADGGAVGSKKEVYLRLCDHPIIIEEGSKVYFRKTFLSDFTLSVIFLPIKKMNFVFEISKHE